MCQYPSEIALPNGFNSTTQLSDSLNGDIILKLVDTLRCLSASTPVSLVREGIGLYLLLKSYNLHVIPSEIS